MKKLDSKFSKFLGRLLETKYFNRSKGWVDIIIDQKDRFRIFQIPGNSIKLDITLDQ